MGPRISWRSGDPSRDASSGLNPEELVAEAESPNEDPAVVRPLSAEAVRKGMLRLGPEDQDMLQAILFDGLTQEEYARRVNITQSGISYRLTRALRRLEWLTVGPGSWFTPLELKRALESTMGERNPRRLAFLVICWMTLNKSEAIRRVRQDNPHRNASRWWSLAMRDLAALSCEHPELRVYYEGFCEIRLQHVETLLYFPQITQITHHDGPRKKPSPETRAKMSMAQSIRRSQPQLPVVERWGRMQTRAHIYWEEVRKSRVRTPPRSGV